MGVSRSMTPTVLPSGDRLQAAIWDLGSPSARAPTYLGLRGLEVGGQKKECDLFAPKKNRSPPPVPRAKVPLPTGGLEVSGLIFFHIHGSCQLGSNLSLLSFKGVGGARLTRLLAFKGALGPP
jgi:hypothetical protein